MVHCPLLLYPTSFSKVMGFSWLNIFIFSAGAGFLLAGVGFLVRNPLTVFLVLRNLWPGFLVILRLLHIKGIPSNHFLNTRTYIMLFVCYTSNQTKVATGWFPGITSISLHHDDFPSSAQHIPQTKEHECTMVVLLQLRSRGEVHGVLRSVCPVNKILPVPK